jgi:hypothetical protein
MGLHYVYVGPHNGPAHNLEAPIALGGGDLELRERRRHSSFELLTPLRVKFSMVCAPFRST